MSFWRKWSSKIDDKKIDEESEYRFEIGPELITFKGNDEEVIERNDSDEDSRGAPSS